MRLLQLAQLGVLHAIGGPGQFLFRVYIDHELIGQTIDHHLVLPDGRALAACGNVGAVARRFANVGLLVLDGPGALDGLSEQVEIVVGEGVLCHAADHRAKTEV